MKKEIEELKDTELKKAFKELVEFAGKKNTKPSDALNQCLKFLKGRED